MTTTTTPKPPSSLQSAIAVIWAKATFALVHAVQSLLMQGSDEAALLGLTDTNLLIGAAGGILAAVLLYVAGWLTWKGSRSARLITGVIVVAFIGFQAWSMFAHHTVGAVGSGLVWVVFGFLVLYMLYGNEKTSAYFDEIEAQG